MEQWVRIEYVPTQPNISLPTLPLSHPSCYGCAIISLPLNFPYPPLSLSLSLYIYSHPLYLPLFVDLPLCISPPPISLYLLLSLHYLYLSPSLHPCSSLPVFSQANSKAQRPMFDHLLPPKKSQLFKLLILTENIWTVDLTF